MSRGSNVRSSIENETIINFNEVEEEARLWTASQTSAKAWKKAGVAVEQVGKRAWIATVPKAWVRVRAPRKWDE